MKRVTFFIVRFVVHKRNMTDFLSPIVGVADTSPRRGTPPFRQATPATFAYAADAPLLSLSRHFPRFNGDIYPFHRESLPRRRKRGLFFVFASVAKQSPGRVNYRTLLSPIVGVADTSPEGGSEISLE